MRVSSQERLLHQILLNIAVPCAYLAAIVEEVAVVVGVGDVNLTRTVFPLVCTLVHVAFFVGVGAAAQYFATQVLFSSLPFLKTTPRHPLPAT